MSGMPPSMHRDYIVDALTIAGAMRPVDADGFLAEHEARARAKALREAADTLAKWRGMEHAEAELRRMAEAGDES